MARKPAVKRTPRRRVQRRTAARHKRARVTAPHVSVAQQTSTATHKDAFLQHYVSTGNIAGACRLTGIGRRTVYHWLEDDQHFKPLFDDAQVDAADSLEQEARRRALVGTEKPVFQGGRQVGKIREYSDTLLIFLLKGAKPDKYRERFEHTGKDGGPIRSEHLMKSAKTSLMEKLAQLADRADKSIAIATEAASARQDRS